MPIIEKQWTTTVEQPVSIETGGVHLKGDLIVPEDVFGLVLFAAGGEMSRSSSRSRRIAREFENQGLAVLLVNLLTPDEEEENLDTGRFRADVPLLASRLTAILDWVDRQPEFRDLPVGIFGQGVTAAASLAASAEQPSRLGAVVCRSGRADLAGSALAKVRVPVLLLTSGADEKLVGANESALLRLCGSLRRELVLIPSTPSQADEADEIEAVADLATDWFSEALIELC
jgi:putative phosphoribosyl transferase